MSVFLLKAKNHIVDLDLGHTQITDGIFEVLKRAQKFNDFKVGQYQSKRQGDWSYKKTKKLKGD